MRGVGRPRLGRIYVGRPCVGLLSVGITGGIRLRAGCRWSIIVAQGECGKFRGGGDGFAGGRRWRQQEFREDGGLLPEVAGFLPEFAGAIGFRIGVGSCGCGWSCGGAWCLRCWLPRGLLWRDARPGLPQQTLAVTALGAGIVRLGAEGMDELRILRTNP